MNDSATEHVRQMEALMRTKGYFGHFQLSATADRFSVGGNLRYVLERYINHLDSRNKATGEFSLYNCLDHSRDRRISCEFQMSYHAKHGMKIFQLRISHNSDQPKFLHVSHPMKLLAANVVKNWYPKEPLWKKFLKGRPPFSR